MTVAMTRHIALMGRARSGKDTVASHLVENFGYRRVAFADPLKEMALKADPYIEESDWWEGGSLAGLVEGLGWESVKDQWPDVRRFLQSLGSAVRDVLGEDVWLRKGLDAALRAQWSGHPVVFTDVRYRNEATALRHLRYTMVRIERPGLDSGDQHASETELDDYRADHVIVNDGSVSDLFAKLEGLVR